MQSDKPDVYEQITAAIMSALEAGTEKYEMPWHLIGTPVNAFSRKAYRGINTLALWVRAAERGYASTEWATYRQWSEAGAQIRRGEKSTAVVFWKFFDETEKDSSGDESSAQKEHVRCFARAYHVFNAEQVNGYTPTHSGHPALNEEQRIAAAEQFFSQLPGDVEFGGDRAAYFPSLDLIRMPHFSQFKSPETFVSTYAHERVHWTGAKPRLNRDLSGRFGSESYAMEELVAELGSAFVCASLGVRSEPRTDHAPYINSWLRVLNGDRRAIFTAASKAQEAADYLHGLVSLAHEKAS
jgi:antirestriction protein ArdC